MSRDLSIDESVRDMITIARRTVGIDGPPDAIALIVSVAASIAVHLGLTEQAFAATAAKVFRDTQEDTQEDAQRAQKKET